MSQSQKSFLARPDQCFIPLTRPEMASAMALCLWRSGSASASNASTSTRSIWNGWSAKIWQRLLMKLMASPLRYW